MTMGIYRITNKINNKNYIGESIDVERRWGGHKSQLKNNNHGNFHLQSSYNKNGIENFEHALLEECLFDNLRKRQAYWIDRYDSCNRKVGYNIVEPDNENPNKERLSEETKEKISKANKGNKHTKEAIKKMSECKIGENNPAYRRTGDKHPMYGRAGDKHPMYGIKGKDHPMFGHKHTSIVKKKMSKSKTGENNPAAKLTWEDVREIRNDHINKKIKASKIAKTYNMNERHINSVIDNEVWYDKSYIPLIRSYKEANSAENNPAAKLTWEDVREIRYRFANEKITHAKLKKIYKITTIGGIINNKLWYDENYVPPINRGKK